MTMGTAATMMSLAEALGLSMPGASSIPAVDSNHNQNGLLEWPQGCGDGLGGSEADRYFNR